jgi:hypothetical protein
MGGDDPIKKEGGWMRLKNVGVLTVLIVLGAMLMSVTNANALCPSDCELFWQATTKYTDGQDIEPQDLPLKYIVEWDGNVIATTENLSVPLPKPYGHNVAHTAKIKTVTASGTEGEYSDPFMWSSPKGIPEKVSVPGIGVR